MRRKRRLGGPLDRVTVERRRRHRERRAVGVPAREGENLVAVLVGEAGVGEANDALAGRHERAADRLDAHRAGSGRANDTLH